MYWIGMYETLHQIRLAIGWTMIAVGFVGMTAHLLVTTHWLWHLLSREEKPFWVWLVSLYREEM